MQRCPACNEENPDRFRLCGYCGTTLAPPAAPEEVRKVVTVVFCDLQGSTSLGERLDSESLREVLAVYFSAMKVVLERHGGTVEKYIGDAIMAVFGLPQMHEDDALRAVRAAFEMPIALAEVNLELQAGWGVTLVNRTGVNTGEVVAGDSTTGQRLATGDTVNVAARLEQAAPPTGVLLGESTYRLVRDAVEVEPVETLELKGKSEHVPAYRLISVEGGEAISRRVDLPMVGRHHELGLILATFAESKERSACRLVTILGSAGLGKSRLVEELVREVGETATVLRGRCLPYGEGITFWPVAEVVRRAAGIVNEDGEQGARAKLWSLLGSEEAEAADRIASMIGLSPNAYDKDELLWSIGRLFEVLARRNPLVIVFDDIHWAEATFLDLVEHVLDAALSVPLLLVCAARHELLEERPNWAEGRGASRRVELRELSADEGAIVVRNLLGEGRLPDSLEARILEIAGGNPLFVEQMLSMLIDEGAITESDGRMVFTGASESVHVPPNVSSLLASRLDRLSPIERTVAQRAAVIGLDFFPGALRALASDEDRAVDLAPPLSALCRKHLVRRAESSFGSEETYQFSHILVRDAAYERLLKRTRARLHERFALWLVDLAGARIQEHEEIVGYHLEQAFRYHVELGSVDEDGRALGIRASSHLGSAGRRAFARGDMPAAANLLYRAAALLGDDSPDRARLLLDAGEALTEIGELARAEAALSEAVERASARGDAAIKHAAELARLQLRYTTDAQSTEESVVEAVERQIPLLEAAGYDYSLARAWRLLTYVHWTATRFGSAAEAAERTIRHATAAGDTIMARRFLGSLAISVLYGPTPVIEAIDYCEDVLIRAGDDRKAKALAELALAHLEAMRGDFGRARLLYRRSRASLEEFGWRLFAALTSLDSAFVEILAGDLDAAERELRNDYAALQQMGERNYISTTAALLADVRYRQGSYEDADRFARVCEDVASSDDVASQFLWRCVRGKLLAEQGSHDDAEASLQEALGLIEPSDQLDWKGNGLMDLAEVRRIANRNTEAAAAAEQAAELFSKKGNVVSAARATELAATLRTIRLSD